MLDWAEPDESFATGVRKSRVEVFVDTLLGHRLAYC